MGRQDAVHKHHVVLPGGFLKVWQKFLETESARSKGLCPTYGAVFVCVVIVLMRWCGECAKNLRLCPYFLCLVPGFLDDQLLIGESSFLHSDALIVG